jgi:hypothetical protein
VYVCIHLFIYWWDWGLNSGPCSLETQLQSILLWLFWRWYLVNCLPGLVLNFDLPNLSLTSNLNYRPDHWCTVQFHVFEKEMFWEISSVIPRACSTRNFVKVRGKKSWVVNVKFLQVRRSILLITWQEYLLKFQYLRKYCIEGQYK